MAHQTKESNWVDELLDELLADGHSPEAVLGENGLLKPIFRPLKCHTQVLTLKVFDNEAFIVYQFI